MSVPLNIIEENNLDEAVARLKEAAAAKKCWGCGCLHNSLEAIRKTFPEDQRPTELDSAIKEAENKLIPVKYDCLGCAVCYPPLAMNALNVETEACPAETVETREGWPPLPGNYLVRRYQAPVAVCTLTDEKLTSAVASAAGSEIALVGSVYTENLGIERIIQNTISNPNIRFLVLCGSDSHQAIGHLPGQSLLSLAHDGVDERSRIIGACGKRPMLKNLKREVVEHFRKTVEVVDLVGNEDASEILDTARACAARSPGPAQAFLGESVISPIQGYIPERMVSDPSGYFVVYPDRTRDILSLEHYGNDGLLRHVIEGRSAAEIYIPVIDRGFISRLDHAAYLGRELARAERTLADGSAYVQDAAPEHQPHTPSRNTTGLPVAKSSQCGCGPSCGGS